MIGRLLIIGLGLIGGSLALALRKSGADVYLTGCDCDPDCLHLARQRGVFDAVVSDPVSVACDADIIMVATPPSQYPVLFRGLVPALGRGRAVITDAGSVKCRLIRYAEQELGEFFPRFVPGHPIAGTEFSGLHAAFAELFEQHRVILTPLPATDTEALAAVRRMWELSGASVSLLDPTHHDEVLAATSHLPHVLAYALVDCLAQLPDRHEVFQFAAGGFADFTRIASSSPLMWHDICLLNREPLLAMLGRFESHVAGLRRLLEQEDSAGLMELFSGVKGIRDQFRDVRKLRDVDQN